MEITVETTETRREFQLYSRKLILLEHRQVGAEVQSGGQGKGAGQNLRIGLEGGHRHPDKRAQGQDDDNGQDGIHPDIEAYFLKAVHRSASLIIAFVHPEGFLYRQQHDDAYHQHDHAHGVGHAVVIVRDVVHQQDG